MMMRRLWRGAAARLHGTAVLCHQHSELTLISLCPFCPVSVCSSPPQDRAHLLYRASVDGFRRASFACKCVGEGRTLTLVKGSGFLFGAFSLPRWPADGTAADPTGKSFLFSLVNKLDRPARFALRDAGHALEMAADGVRFGGCKRAGGAQTSWPNFGLMVHGRAADQPDGNTANHAQRYSAAYAPEDLGRPGAAPEMCDETFFGGQQFFAAEEIEVYKL